MYELKPKDFIAIIVLLCVTFLVFNGYTGPLTDMVSLMIGYYFGHRKSGIDEGV